MYKALYILDILIFVKKSRKGWEYLKTTKFMHIKRNYKA